MASAHLTELPFCLNILTVVDLGTLFFFPIALASVSPARTPSALNLHCISLCIPQIHAGTGT